MPQNATRHNWYPKRNLDLGNSASNPTAKVPPYLYPDAFPATAKDVCHCTAPKEDRPIRFRAHTIPICKEISVYIYIYITHTRIWMCVCVYVYMYVYTFFCGRRLFGNDCNILGSKVGSAIYADPQA